MASRQLSVLAAFLWGCVVHSAAVLVGGFLLLLATALGRGRQGERPEPWGAAEEASRWLLEQLASPFFELSSVLPEGLPPEETASGAGGAAGSAWAEWVLGAAGALVLLAAGLGLLVLLRSAAWALQTSPLAAPAERRVRRALLCAAAPYAVLAAVLLAWQAEANAFLAASSSWSFWGEDLPSPHREQRREVYKAAHSAFTKAYALHQCQGQNITNGHPRRLSCEASGFEAKLMQDAVLKLCRVQKSPRQVARLKQCFALGDSLGLEPEGPYSESYGFYCRCWAASLGLLPALAGAARLLWSGVFLGALAVLYVAAEPGLAALAAEARREVLAFAVGATGLLVLKAVILRPLMFDL